MNEFTYMLFPSAVRHKGRLRSGYAICEVRMVGQRFAPASEGFNGYWAPRSLFEIRRLGTAPTERSARAFIRKLPKTTWSLGGRFSDITFTGSISGPGFWPVDPNNGPLFAVVDADAARKADPLWPVFQTVSRLGE